MGLTLLHHALHNHLNHFMDVLESLLLRMAPGSAALLHQRWTVCVPPLSVRLYHDQDSHFSQTALKMESAPAAASPLQVQRAAECGVHFRHAERGQCADFRSD